MVTQDPATLAIHPSIINTTMDLLKYRELLVSGLDEISLPDKPEFAQVGWYEIQEYHYI
jgi:hypothetical protein